MPEAGTFFRSFYIIAPLGEGGMSEVFLGYDLSRHCLVALKFLTGVFGTDRGAVGRMKREGEIYRKLDHPNVVKLVDQGPLPEGGLFLVQEFLRGESIREAMGGEDAITREPLPLPRCMALLQDSAAALNCAHRQAIVHRDVKPDNIMVGPDGRGTIYDFGIAYRRDDHVITQAGTIMGTLTYAAPEARAGESVGPPADTFGLGAVLYEMLTGELAIQAKNFKEVLDHSVHDVPRPSELRPGLPAVCDEICITMMEDEPEDRYPSLGDLLVQLGKLHLESPTELRETLFGPERLQMAEEALASFRAGDLARAKTTTARLLTQATGDEVPELQHLMGKVQHAEGNHASAARAFERGLSQAPYALDMALDYAMLLMAQRDYDGAAEVLEERPSVVRGNFLVRSLLDTVQALPSAPASAFQPGGGQGLLGGLLGRLSSLWKG